MKHSQMIVTHTNIYAQHNSQKLVGCVLLRNSSGSKLREVVQDKVICKRKTYVKLATH